jgi:hypothetical protein
MEFGEVVAAVPGRVTAAGEDCQLLPCYFRVSYYQQAFLRGDARL